MSNKVSPETAQVTSSQLQSTELKEEVANLQDFSTTALRIEMTKRQRKIDLDVLVNDVQSSTAMMVDDYFQKLERIDPKFRDHKEHYTKFLTTSVADIIKGFWEMEGERQRELDQPRGGVKYRDDSIPDANLTRQVELQRRAEAQAALLNENK